MSQNSGELPSGDGKGHPVIGSVSPVERGAVFSRLNAVYSSPASIFLLFQFEEVFVFRFGRFAEGEEKVIPPVTVDRDSAVLPLVFRGAAPYRMTRSSP